MDVFFYLFNPRALKMEYNYPSHGEYSATCTMFNRISNQTLETNGGS